MADERKSLCDPTVLFPIPSRAAAITECPREVDSKVQIQNADCRLQSPATTTLFPCQLCRLFPAHSHTCCFFASVSSAEEASSDIPPSRQVMWNRDSAGEKPRRAETRSLKTAFLLFHFPFHHQNGLLHLNEQIN